MRKYVLIGFGGALGAISRVLVKGINFTGNHGVIPLNTLIINVSGSLILAFILTVAFEIWFFDEDIRLGIATGFLGAYTTFSTLCREAAELIGRGLLMPGIIYVSISVILGLLAAYLGVTAARSVVPRVLKVVKNKVNDREEMDGGAE